MESVLRSLTVYIVLLLIFRVTGKRTLAQITTFDFVLLLIVSESTQQAMVGEDFSVTNAVLVIMTLFVADYGLAMLKRTLPRLDKLLEGCPLVLVEDGTPLKDRMRKVDVEESDILESARETQGLARMEQIKYAVLERTGQISIIPRRPISD
ncbi:MAG: DUF421 domain-containing protein [Phycisphaerales bacterium]|nr:DUF421 domain-containing protein [Phycisphaerales bacterium]